APSPLRRLDKTGQYLAPAGDADRPASIMSELMAENATLRRPDHFPLQVKWLAYTKTDSMFLVLLAKAVQNWKQVLFNVVEDDATLLVSPENGFKCMQPLLYCCC